MERLTWPDLIIDEITPDQFRDWIAPWAGIVEGRIAPVFMSRFGFWFLQRPEGQVELLDVYSGELSRIAETHEDFVREVNEQWWQEVYLFSELAYELQQAGKIPGSSQCYALCPHPALGAPNPANGEKVDTRFVMVMDALVWQSMCAQSLGLGR